MMSRTVIASIELEYRRYRDLGSGGLAQLSEAQLSQPGPGGNNSLIVLVRHISGNLRSRFTDFLSSDGEKPGRDRETEFDTAPLARAEVDALWASGWRVLFDSLAPLDDGDLQRTVQIRGVDLLVIEALHRSLGHVAMHVGQMVYLGKSLLGGDWRHLTIPPGKSAEYNRNPAFEKGFPPTG